MKTKSALSYFGSDSGVAEQLAAKLDHCKHVTIPFVGGASIIPHLKARSIVANDLHGLAINFYRVLAGLEGDHWSENLIFRCKHTLSHPEELIEAEKAIGSHLPVMQAWGFWALCWLGRKGKGGTKHQGGAVSIRRTPAGGTNASRITTAARDLEEWAKHFKRCEWDCKCFRNLLPLVADHDDCGIYVDSPWVGSGRNYLHSFVRKDHEDLAAALRRFNKTTVVVRYDDDPLVRGLYKGWEITRTASRDQTNTIRGELSIVNMAIRKGE